MTNNHHKTISSTHHTHKGSHSTTSQACAACKYQRRKCAPDCILAPYFPFDRQRQFFNAHKLFGVSNITKIIHKLDQYQKDEAMRTIIFQSDVRAHDPVGGCYRLIRELQNQIEFSQAELSIVLHHLSVCRAQSQQSMLDYSSNKHDNEEPWPQHGDLGYNNFGEVGHHGYDNNIMPLQEIDSWGMGNSGSPSLEIKQSSSSPHNECEDIKRLLLNDLDIPTDEQHSFRFEFDETIQPPCSSEEILFHEETTLIKQDNSYFQHDHQDHDLKVAASLFSLTNCTSY